MRILLLGEYSGFFANLKAGLKELGHDVTLLAYADEFKKIPGADGDLYKGKTSGSVGKLVNKIFKPPFDKRFFANYDVVLWINVGIFLPPIIHKMLKKIKKHNKKVFLSSCGYDYALYKAYNEGKFEYYMFDEIVETMPRFHHPMWVKYYKKHGELEDIEKYIDNVIPIAYEYKLGYKKTTDVTLLPISTKEIEFKPIEIKDKIIFFHGLNRESEKGTKYIVEALEKLKKNYPDEVEVIVKGKMPYQEYVELMRKTDVVLDQCKSYWYGINALIGLAQGKIVLSGRKDESLKEANISPEECPIIEITPNSEQIYKQLEMIVKNKKDLPELSKKGRAYVEKYHDATKVAEQYIKIFES